MIPHSKPWITETDIECVTNVLKSGMIADGTNNYDFIEALKKFLPSRHIQLSSSGTAALTTAIEAFNFPIGSEVIMPSYVCGSVYVALYEAGVMPVLCDIGSEWNLNTDAIGAVITPHTKAIVVPHMFGIPVDIEEIVSLGIPVIEDCSQAVGSRVNGRRTGTFGDVSVFSLNATKCFTTGTGGAVSFNRKDIDIPTTGFQMSDMQSALGISQLKRYGLFLSSRLEIAERYIKELPNEPISGMKKVWDRSIYFRFLLQSKAAKEFEVISKRFKEKGVTVRRGVDTLIHREIGLPDAAFPNTVNAFESTISIPIYPSLTEDQIWKIIHSVNTLYDNGDL